MSLQGTGSIATAFVVNESKKIVACGFAGVIFNAMSNIGLANPERNVLNRFPDLRPAAEVFSKLAEDWRKETCYLSDISEICTHPAYQRIIGMGSTALPFIFAALAREPEQWFWALEAITGEQPVPQEYAGNLERMRHYWLEWAAQSQLAVA